MAINKVVYGGDTLIDLTSDTVTPPKLKIGAVAHAANGNTIQGELAGVYYGTTAPSPSDAPVWIDPSGTANAIGTEDVKYKIYNSVTDLGLASGNATITNTYAAMPASSILICQATDFLSSEVPNNYGIVEIVHFNASRGIIHFYSKEMSDGDYRMFLNSSNIPTGVWLSITTTDTGWIDCRSENITAGILNYRIKDNVLYLWGDGLAYQATARASVVIGYLPITLSDNVNYYGRTGYDTCQAWMQPDGTIIISAEIANPTGIAVFYAGPLD